MGSLVQTCRFWYTEGKKSRWFFLRQITFSAPPLASCFISHGHYIVASNHLLLIAHSALLQGLQNSVEKIYILKLSFYRIAAQLTIDTKIPTDGKYSACLQTGPWDAAVPAVIQLWKSTLILPSQYSVPVQN